MQTTKLSGIGKKLFEVIEFDDKEILISEIRKHPFGLGLIYGSGIIVSLAIFSALVGMTILIQDNNIAAAQSGETIRLLLLVGSVLISLLVLGVTFIAGHLYNSNVMLLTNEKIAQVLYKSLFSRKISQLSIGDVQDVTVVQNGVFARLFNYGTLVIETAGEQQNYTFSYAIDPYQSAKLIVGSHEENLKDFGN